jgi:hypothetical protein
VTDCTERHLLPRFVRRRFATARRRQRAGACAIALVVITLVGIAARGFEKHHGTVTQALSWGTVVAFVVLLNRYLPSDRKTASEATTPNRA